MKYLAIVLLNINVTGQYVTHQYRQPCLSYNLVVGMIINANEFLSAINYL